MFIKKLKLAIIGLGYVGLPLAVEFSKKKEKVVGYDLNIKRIKELNQVIKTFEINNGKFKKNKNLTLTNKVKNIKDCNCYILTVPTPINKKTNQISHYY